MYFNTGTVLAQPPVTTNTTCPVVADTNLAVSGIGLMADIDNPICVPAINRDVIWANATQTLSLYYNGTGYSATNVTGTRVGIRVRSQSATATLTVKLFYTTSGNVKVYFTGTPATQAVTSTRTDYTIGLAGLSATNIPAGSKIGVEFSWNDPAGMRLSVNQSASNDKLIVDETYQYENCAGVATAYPWRDISATGTTVALADDATSAAINLGFTFSYGGTNYTQLRIGSNGWLFFGGTATTFTNTALPSGVGAVVMPFWDDLNPASVASRIRYQTLDTAPNRIFVVSYLDVPHYCTGAIGCTSNQTNAPIRYTFQAQFRETRNETIFSYQTMGTLGGAFTVGAYTDSGATIGVEVNNTNYTQFSYNTNSITNNSAIRFFSASPICGIGPHHIRVQHDGNGLTCTPETLTVIACANAACTAPHYTASTVTGNVTWAGAPGGSVPFNITVGGTTTVSLPVTTVQTVTLGTSAVSPAPLNPSDCWNTATATANCSLPFADSALLASAPNHVAETVQNITISAVRKADNALNCVPAFANVSRAVNLKCAYTNPTTGTLPVRVAGSALNAGNNAALACDATGQSPTLAFNASGTATATLQYADAGQMTLNATYTGSAGTGDAGLVMTGSGSFIAAPASFAFSAITAAPIKAGATFNATVTAMNSLNNPTPNFLNQTVAITSINPQPGIGNATAINTPLTGFSNGAAAANLIWNEVGMIDLKADLANYLASGLAVTGTQTSVGRFQPAYFDTAVTPGCATFTYAGSTTPVKAGQPFAVTVTAKEVGGGITANYAGAANAYLTTLSNAGVTAGLAGNTIAATNFTNGVGSANVTYEVATPQTALLTLTIRATNADPTPVSSSGHVEGTTDIRSGRAKLGNAHGSELLGLPIPFRTEYWNNGWVFNPADSCSGDVSLGAGNAVSVALSASLTTCAQDNGNPGLSGSGCAVAGPVAQRFKEGVTPGIGFAGDFNLWLKAPGAGNTGTVTVTGNVPTWLQYPWGGGVAINPTARATFGVYKGNNNFIYLRENY